MDTDTGMCMVGKFKACLLRAKFKQGVLLLGSSLSAGCDQSALFSSIDNMASNAARFVEFGKKIVAVGRNYRYVCVHLYISWLGVSIAVLILIEQLMKYPSIRQGGFHFH